MRKISASIAAGAAVLLSIVWVAPSAVADEKTEVDVVARVAPHDVNAAIDTPLLTGGESNVSVEGLNIAVSSDATAGVSVSAGEGFATIGLPFAEDASEGTSTLPGTVTYENGNDTSSVVLVHDTGSVQVATVIDAPEAPTRYDYPLTLPEDSHLAMADGSVAILDDISGDEIGSFAAPWARDASGRDVPTRYEINGTTVTQVVDHSAGYAYPVVADPVYTTSTVYIPHATVVKMYNGMNKIGDVCTILPVPYWVGIACAGFPGKSAVEQAYWQNKRVKVSYVSCGFNYCSYNTFTAVP